MGNKQTNQAHTGCEKLGNYRNVFYSTLLTISVW